MGRRGAEQPTPGRGETAPIEAGAEAESEKGASCAAP